MSAYVAHLNAQGEPLPSEGELARGGAVLAREQERTGTNEQVNQLVMNADLATMPEAVLDPTAEQLRVSSLAAALRIFGKFGFDEGVAGHHGP